MAEEKATISMVLAVVTRTQEDVKELKEEFKILNGTVREHCKDIAVLKDWRESQADPATKQIPGIKADVARIAVQTTGVGAIVGVMVVVAKALGVL